MTRKNKQEDAQIISQRINAHKEYIDTLVSLKSTDKDRFWKNLKILLEKTIKGNEMNQHLLLASHIGDNSVSFIAELKYAEGAITIAKDIISQVEKADSHLEIAKEEIRQLKERLQEIKNNIDEQ